MSYGLTAKEIRALKITSEKPAHEVEGAELDSLKHAALNGLVEYGPYRKVLAHNKVWNQRTVTITDKGREYLKGLSK